MKKRVMKKKCHLFTLLAQLHSDERGFVLPLVTILLVVIVGLSVLAFDGARVTTLQTQLQQGADSLALTGGVELDRLSDSLDRARKAICGDPSVSSCTVTNFYQNTTLPSSWFGSASDPNIRVANIRFFDALPADTTDPVPASYETTDPTQARFVEVTVSPTSLNTILPASFFGGPNTITGNANATAGADQVVCDLAPMYVCNPFETDGMTYAQATQALQNAATDPTFRRRLIRLRAEPGSSSNSNLPGNYGFLSAPNTNGFNAVRDAIARIHSPACFRQQGVDFQTGFAGNSIAPAFNVRLDVYDASMNANKNDANYAPAKNVRKGYWLPNGSDWCGATAEDPPNVNTRALALSDALPAGVNIGSENWDFEAYWDKNHPGLAGAYPNGWSNSNLPSRHEVYQYETSQGANPGGLQDASASPAPPTPSPQEIGAPRCNTNEPPPTIERRVLWVALINCRALVADGTITGGTNNNVPVASFGEFFLARPVDGSTGDVLAEFVKLIDAGPGGGKVYYQVQLYR